MARCVEPAAGHERTEAVVREIADIIGGHINAGRLSDGEACSVVVTLFMNYPCNMTPRRKAIDSFERAAHDVIAFFRSCRDAEDRPAN